MPSASPGTRENDRLHFVNKNVSEASNIASLLLEIDVKGFIPKMVKSNAELPLFCM